MRPRLQTKPALKRRTTPPSWVFRSQRRGLDSACGTYEASTDGLLSQLWPNPTKPNGEEPHE